VLEPTFSALDITEVHAARPAPGPPLLLVAGVHYALLHRLQLDWLRDELARLPRDSRFHTLARASMRADLFDRLRVLTADVLDTGSSATSVGEPAAAALVARWVDANAARVDRFDHVIEELRAAESPDLAVLSVALHAVSAVVSPGGAGQVE
jgi:glutamate dehydrogenase